MGSIESINKHDQGGNQIPPPLIDRNQPESNAVPDAEAININHRLMMEEMLVLATQESVADKGPKGEVCSCCNGYLDPDTGEIMQFGNSQNVRSIFIKNGVQFSFLVSPDREVIDVKFPPESDGKHPSRQAISVINETVRQWNHTIYESVEEDNARLVDNAGSFAELYQALGGIKKIVGGDGVARAGALWAAEVEKLEKGQAGYALKNITSKLGLRKKVQQLLIMRDHTPEAGLINSNQERLRQLIAAIFADIEDKTMITEGNDTDDPYYKYPFFVSFNPASGVVLESASAGPSSASLILTTRGKIKEYKIPGTASGIAQKVLAETFAGLK